jgi:hypothetical protein
MEENNRIPWHVLIDGLIAHNKEEFFKALYCAMSKHPSYIIMSDIELDRKMSIIDQMIEFYEVKEDYEKCLFLLNIKKEVKIC